jgi:hypothetical protein
MLAAYRLADLSALEGHYAGVRAGAQFGGACGCAARFFWVSAGRRNLRCTFCLSQCTSSVLHRSTQTAH